MVDQDPNAGEEADKGSTVTLEVSSGPGNVSCPRWRTAAGSRRSASCENAGLKVTLEREPSDDGREGYAIRTVPGAGKSVVEGQPRARCSSARGPEQVAVPDVVGLVARLGGGQPAREGLKVVVREEPSDQPRGRR